ncbi:hypothetical protein E3N88_07690 [Mikania micrantha]|uniref:Pentacotripeptide-repeat region of PRORP domain-containing protein n=1 Tax=Mikania micrantha TaxID=192012 RepID=A0A5N6PH78_9ASTR|nr:hypothetical protein E3N88_07690 [Mikania micrantha]
MIDDAIKFFKEMVFDKGILPNAKTYNSLIYGLCLSSHWDEVSKMLKEMEAEKISPTVHTFSVLVDAFCKEGKVNEAEAVMDVMVAREEVVHMFHEITRKGMKPNIVTYNTMILKKLVIKTQNNTNESKLDRVYGNPSPSFIQVLNPFQRN